MVDIDIKEIQKAELEILGVVCNTLARYGIMPFLIGGNCLGVIRHGGFIPWDDDIDIGLMREEYEKARKILIEELPEGYTWCDHLTEKEYPYNFGKVRKDNTAFVHGGDAHLDIHHGLYIDIFPFDAAHSDRECFNKYYKKIRKLKLLVDLKCMSYKKHGVLRPLYQLPIIFASHIFVNKRIAQKKLDKAVVKFNGGEHNSCVSNYFGFHGEKEYYDISLFGKGKQVDFEGVKCLIPEEYDAYLTCTYGDYMKLPPKEKQISHHDAVFISLSEEYKKERD